MKFEMADSTNPEEIIMASQRALVDSMLDVIKDIRTDELGKQPGLTWVQIEYFLLRFRDKKPEIIVQSEEM